MKSFKKVVIPFLKKRNWSLVVGNGAWLFTDENENHMFSDNYPKDKQFQEIEDLFKITLEGTSYALGEFMHDYEGK